MCVRNHRGCGMQDFLLGDVHVRIARHSLRAYMPAHTYRQALPGVWLWSQKDSYSSTVSTQHTHAK